MVSFNQKIENALSPFNYIEFSNAEAFEGLSTQPQRLLLIDLAEPSQPIAQISEAANQTSTMAQSETVKKKAKQVEIATAGDLVSQPTEDEQPKKKPLIPLEKNKVIAGMEAAKYELTKRLEEALAAVKEVSQGIEIYLLLMDGKEKIADFLPETQYTQIALLVDDEDLIKDLRTILEKRWGQEVQLDGHLFLASSADHSALKKQSTKMLDLNVSLIPCPVADKSHIWAATFAATNTVYAVTPSRPYQTLKVKGISYVGQGPNLEQRNDLLKSGVSTWKVSGDSIHIDRLVTTYSKDASYRDLNTKQTLSYIRYDFNRSIAAMFPRHMLAKDNYAYQGPVITPTVAKAFAISRYRKWQANNLVQDPDGSFAKKVRVEVDEKQGDKLNFYLPVHVMGQWVITQTQIAFRI